MYNIQNIRRDLTISTELERADTKEFMLSGSFHAKYRSQQSYAALLEDSSQWFSSGEELVTGGSMGDSRVQVKLFGDPSPGCCVRSVCEGRQTPFLTSVLFGMEIKFLC